MVWVGVLFGPGVDVGRERDQISRSYPELLPIEQLFPFEVLSPPDASRRIGGAFPFFLAVPSAATADQVRRDLGAFPGIVDIVVGFPTQNTGFPERLDLLTRAAVERVNRQAN